MKTSLTIFSLISFFQIGYSQISINSADMPVSGDTLRYSAALIDSTTKVTFGISGPNVQWDFSSVQPKAQGVLNYLPKNQTPYNSQFSNNGYFGRKAADTLDIQGNIVTNVYEYYQTNSQSFSRIALAAKFSFLTIANTFSNPDEIYQFPLNYGDVDSSTFSFSQNIFLVGSYYSEGYRKNTVDAYGSITTPYGTYNCLRVKTELFTKDSVNFNNQASVINNFTIEYKWLAAGTKIPVMQVNGTVINGEFVPTTMVYRDNYRPISKDLTPKARFSASTIYPAIHLDTVIFTSQVLDIERTSYNYTITPNSYSYVNNTNRYSPRPEIVFNIVGYYSVEFSVSNGFGSNDSTYTNYIYASLNSSVEEKDILSRNLKVFPNPVIGNTVSIAFELSASGPVTIVIVDLMGKQVYFENKGNFPRGQNRISQELPLFEESGTFILKIISPDGIANQKLIRQ